MSSDSARYVMYMADPTKYFPEDSPEFALHRETDIDICKSHTALSHFLVVEVKQRLKGLQTVLFEGNCWTRGADKNTLEITLTADWRPFLVGERWEISASTPTMSSKAGQYYCSIAASAGDPQLWKAAVAFRESSAPGESDVEFRLGFGEMFCRYVRGKYELPFPEGSQVVFRRLEGEDVVLDNGAASFVNSIADSGDRWTTGTHSD